MSRSFLLLSLTLLLALAAPPAQAQQPASDQMLRVFLECGPCDFDFVRTEVSYVDWMRDRADADVHVLWRSETTGSGGRQHTLDLIGLQDYQGKADTLTYTSGRDDTQDITRRGLARVLQMGLMRYVAATSAAARVQIGSSQPAAGAPTPAASAQARDPWNAWVFSISGNGNSNGESSRKFTNISSNMSANRVTGDWKVNLSGRGSYRRQTYTYQVIRSEVTQDTTVISLQRDYNGNGMIVRSVNGHTSVGARFGIGTSTFGNTEFFMSADPAIEYNVFPYTESTRRQLLITYSAGMRSQRYAEETIYLKTEETVPQHSLSTSFSTRQPWGNLSFAVGSSQYLHDTKLYNVNFFTGGSVNVARGFSINLNGNYSMVRDQIALPKRNLTPEEVLLQQRQLATSYNYFASFGISYRFGSAVQNVVNPRFGGGGGGPIFIF